MSRLLEVFPDIDPGFLQAKAVEFDGNYGSISCGVSGGYKIRYCTRTIIIWGLYIFYPIFHCRAVYNAERLIFHDSFLSNLYTKEAIEDGTKKTTFLL